MSSQGTAVDPSVAEAWNRLVTKGMANAISGLSQMIGDDISVTDLKSKRIPIDQTPDLVGGRDAIIAAVHVGVHGPIEGGTGHMVILYAPQTAYDLIDMLMDTPPGSTQSLEEMEQSVLGEVGNVMGSQFLNTLSDETGLDLRVSPPAVMMDMAGAILDPALADLMMESDETVVLDSTFGTADRQIHGVFLVLPNPRLQAALVQRLTVQ